MSSRGEGQQWSARPQGRCVFPSNYEEVGDEMDGAKGRNRIAAFQELPTVGGECCGRDQGGLENAP